MALIGLGVAAIIGLADLFVSQNSQDTPSDFNWREAGYGPADYERSIQSADQQLALGREWVRNGPRQWLRHEGLARALMVKANLISRYDELVEAGSVLSSSADLATEPAGPLFTKAAFAMRTHQLDKAAQALAAIGQRAVPPTKENRAEIAGISGDIQFYRGNMDGAAKLYDQAPDNVSNLYRQAVLKKAQGDFAGAMQLYQQASAANRSATPYQTATLAMRIAGLELAQGNIAASDKWFREANRQFPGFWLIEAHIAQSQALEGDMDEAISAMAKIAETSQSAEIMDALALWLRSAGRVQESRVWAEKAGKIWTSRLATIPEAALGHAVEHELAFGSPKRAIELARQNARLRPYGEAYLLLASALIADGQFNAALGQAKLAEKSGWRSARLYALKAQAFELLGAAEQAALARSKAEDLNPRIFTASTALIWFSHG